MALLNGVGHVGIFDGPIHEMLVLVKEWRDADQHLVEEDAECPPIDSLVMSFARDHLGRKVLGSAAE